MAHLFGYTISVRPSVALVIFIAAWAGLSFLVSDLFERTLRRWGAGRETQFDKLIVATLHGPLLIILLLIGAQIAVDAVELTSKMAHFVRIFLSLTTAFVLILAAIRFYHRVLKAYGEKYEPIKPSLAILNLLGKALIILIGILITLDSLNISITPLLTTLGIGGLAVALAFKDTLANFFAGLYILADRPIRIGDYIKLEGGAEGYVQEVGWRSTRIRTLAGKIVIIPNSKLAELTIANYHLPERSLSLSLPITVGYAEDPGRVENILLEEATRAAAEVEGFHPGSVPSVLLIPGFGESGLQFSLNYEVREFMDQYAVQHALRRRILDRFRKEGIEIPYPQRTIHLRKEED